MALRADYVNLFKKYGLNYSKSNLNQLQDIIHFEDSWHFNRAKNLLNSPMDEQDIYYEISDYYLSDESTSILLDHNFTKYKSPMFLIKPSAHNGLMKLFLVPSDGLAIQYFKHFPLKYKLLKMNQSVLGYKFTNIEPDHLENLIDSTPDATFYFECRNVQMEPDWEILI